MITCCKDCPVRHERCHSNCIIYQTAVDKDRAEKERRAKDSGAMVYGIERAVRICKKMDRYRK